MLEFDDAALQESLGLTILSHKLEMKLKIKSFFIYKLFMLLTSRHRNGRLSNNAALTPILIITINDKK